ncbi:3022_t:CDS:2 [Paraglomus occultum]|uniref:DASH complex subunit DAD3 n=1 Tax=Paraglomus occultum TaxID=144539 RepID=A0A9N8VRW3_9GLOM|nr:3022_t:CDS:2 [Paraglomus occultum]
MTLQQPATVSGLEHTILFEYETLVNNVEKMNHTISQMNGTDVVLLVDKLRTLEKKAGLVYTLFKASVYALVTSIQELDMNAEQGTNRPVL